MGNLIFIIVIELFFLINILQMQEKKSFIFQTQELLCSATKSATYFCINENCQISALICQDSSCNCVSNHKQCQILKIKDFSSKLEKIHNQAYKKNSLVYSSVEKMYDTYIEQLSKSREQFIQWTQLAGLTPKLQQLVKKINNGQQSQLKGKLLSVCSSQLKNKHQFYYFSIQTVQEYQDIYLDKFKEILQKLHRFNGKVPNVNQPSKILDSKSQITAKEFGCQRLALMLPHPVQSFDLLYRGSENQFDRFEFHQKCDNISDTVTLIQVQQNNRIIGGYTPLKWQDKGPGSWYEDESGSSFLFSLTLNEKYGLIDKKNAVLKHRYSGPSFGRGDLQVSMENQKQRICRCRFPESYNNGKFNINSLDARNQFAGVSWQQSFCMEQIQVLKVNWKV